MRFFRIVRALGLASLLALTGAAWATTPSCASLIEAFRATFQEASSYRVGVAIEQGGREIAYELAQQTRRSDGAWNSETIERRGLRRPSSARAQDGDATFGDVPLTCDGHEIEQADDGDVVLSLPGVEDADGAITGWTLRFVRLGPRWLPRELIAGFEANIVFVPVRGRFVTTFDAWRFLGN